MAGARRLNCLANEFNKPLAPPDYRSSNEYGRLFRDDRK